MKEDNSNIMKELGLDNPEEVVIIPRRTRRRRRNSNFAGAVAVLGALTVLVGLIGAGLLHLMKNGGTFGFTARDNQQPVMLSQAGDEVTEAPEGQTSVLLPAESLSPSEVAGIGGFDTTPDPYKAVDVAELETDDGIQRTKTVSLFLTQIANLTEPIAEVTPIPLEASPVTAEGAPSGDPVLEPTQAEVAQPVVDPGSETTQVEVAQPIADPAAKDTATVLTTDPVAVNAPVQTSGEQPAPVSQPVDVAKQPVNVAQPVDTVQQPITAAQPVDTVQHPVTAAQPVDTVQQPANDTTPIVINSEVVVKPGEPVPSNSTTSVNPVLNLSVAPVIQTAQEPAKDAAAAPVQEAAVAATPAPVVPSGQVAAPVLIITATPNSEQLAALEKASITTNLQQPINVDVQVIVPTTESNSAPDATGGYMIEAFADAVSRLGTLVDAVGGLEPAPIMATAPVLDPALADMSSNYTVDPTLVALFTNYDGPTTDLNNFLIENNLQPPAAPTPVPTATTTSSTTSITSTVPVVPITVVPLATQAPNVIVVPYQTPTALPTSGFADEVGIPGLVGLAGILIFVIFMARKLRAF